MPAQLDPALLPAYEALLALTGPQRVEVLRHFSGSVSKVKPARVEYYPARCGCCDCCECGAA